MAHQQARSDSSAQYPFQKHSLSVQPAFTYVLSVSFFAYLMSHVSSCSLPPVTLWVLLLCGLCHCLGQRRFRTSWFLSHFPCAVLWSQTSLHRTMFSHRSQKSGHLTGRSLYSHPSCLVLTLSTASTADSSLPLLTLLL